MRLSRTDLLPLLVVMGGGAFGVLTFGSFVLLTSSSDDAIVPDQLVERRVERDLVERIGADADLEQVVARAAELVREQRDVELDMDRLGTSGGPGSEAGRRLVERNEAMNAEVADLERVINQLTSDALAVQDDAADGLYEALVTIRDDKLKERFRYSRGLVGISDREFAREFEAETTRVVEELHTELQRALDAGEPARAESQEIRPEDRAAIDAGPVFTPMTVRPEITNRDEVVTALMREYPAELRNAGIGGSVVVWFYLTETGQNIDNRISRSSGQEEFDRAALRVARILRFTPALNEGEPVPVWIEVPITFQVR